MPAEINGSEVISIGFIEQIAPHIQKYAPRYGIRVCSPIIAQAVLESASGTSELAVCANNYFGLKYRADRCPTACGIYHKTGSEQNPDGTYTVSAMQWMKFPDMESGVQGYFDFINIPAYANLKEVTVPKTYLTNIREDGYATSLKYVENLMSVISRYHLTKYDTQAEVIKPVNLNIQTLPANPANYGGSRNASSILYLVYHYTANKTDKAASNANYFRNNIVKASAHYFVDEHDIYQSVEDLKTAYSVGGAKWSDCSFTGGGSMFGRITNTNSISIEMCSSNGAVPEATLENAVKLGKELMEKYHIPISNVYRHFDVNGKHCPGWQGLYGQD
ncbi:MAG: N-acetylmuramoyl-L-alanine amidase, partial [Acetatifactor sp.]|nr:N-acetylmuramoyl-L-alanine amidase [Acetatifactor sp.]